MWLYFVLKIPARLASARILSYTNLIEIFVFLKGARFI